jgi:hypothetical protein
MSGFFMRERFGRPQATAVLLLLAFLAQCAWLVSHRASRLTAGELSSVVAGRRQWRGRSLAGTGFGTAAAAQLPEPGMMPASDYDPDHSPLWYLIAAAPDVVFSPWVQPDPLRFWGWLTALPFLIFGVLLGGSLWYVARRLYGNAGGYVALALYCFSPGIIRSSSLWFSEPESGAAWGAFGAVFTAIAVAHTLYAPREVILWNWRRIVLLALSFALAVGSQFALLGVVPLALAFMLYLAPTRRAAALGIWATACVLALLLIYVSYFFSPGVFWQGMMHARFFPILWRAYGMPGAYQRVLMQLGQSSPALLVAVPAALITFAAWPRTRYFGNAAPLLVAALLLLMSVGTPHMTGSEFQFMAVPFLFVFVAGVATDLLESRQAGPVFACLAGLLAANAVWNLWFLWQVGRVSP